MQDASAIKAALQLMHMPANVRFVREARLPTGLVALLQVAAGDREALKAAQEVTGRDADTLVASARFFVEQVLWHPRADHFRLFGEEPGASSAALKRNMALLMAWLHPDAAAPSDAHRAYVSRLTAAWNDLKTPERRQAYEAQLAQQWADEARRRRHFKARINANRDRIARRRRTRRSLWRRVWSMVVGRSHA